VCGVSCSDPVRQGIDRGRKGGYMTRARESGIEKGHLVCRPEGRRKSIIVSGFLKGSRGLRKRTPGRLSQKREKWKRKRCWRERKGVVNWTGFPPTKLKLPNCQRKAQSGKKVRETPVKRRHVATKKKGILQTQRRTPKRNRNRRPKS